MKAKLKWTSPLIVWSFSEPEKSFSGSEKFFHFSDSENSLFLHTNFLDFNYDLKK